jgi:hypothetical protein
MIGVKCMDQIFPHYLKFNTESCHKVGGQVMVGHSPENEVACLLLKLTNH